MQLLIFVFVGQIVALLWLSVCTQRLSYAVCAGLTETLSLSDHWLAVTCRGQRCIFGKTWVNIGQFQVVQAFVLSWVEAQHHLLRQSWRSLGTFHVLLTSGHTPRRSNMMVCLAGSENSGFQVFQQKKMSPSFWGSGITLFSKIRKRNGDFFFFIMSLFFLRSISISNWKKKYTVI